jgi:hypothetical protein
VLGAAAVAVAAAVAGSEVVGCVGLVEAGVGFVTGSVGPGGAGFVFVVGCVYTARTGAAGPASARAVATPIEIPAVQIRTASGTSNVALWMCGIVNERTPVASMALSF